MPRTSGRERTITLRAGIDQGIEVHEMDDRIIGASFDRFEQRV
jgi:hypothetical protein